MNGAVLAVLPMVGAGNDGTAKLLSEGDPRLATKTSCSCNSSINCPGPVPCGASILYLVLRRALSSPSLN